MSATAPVESARQSAVSSSVSALRRMASYALPPEFDRRVDVSGLRIVRGKVETTRRTSEGPRIVWPPCPPSTFSY